MDTTSPPAPDTTAGDESSESSVKLANVAGLLSVGAGAIHAAAAGIHAEHAQLARIFVVLAALQIGAGVWALLDRRRWAAASVVVVNVAAFVGWLVSRLTGVSWVDGLEQREAAQFADSMCAALGVAAALAGAVGFLRAHAMRWRVRLALPALAVAALAVPAMLSASTHVHAHSDDAHDHAADADADHDHAADADHADADDHADGVDHALGRPYDPSLPIDLSGFEGVTPEQQAAAENLVAVTLVRLPQWADYRDAEAAGFHSIGDGATGHEHFINWDWLDDDVWLDPDYPESLVYQPQPDGSRLLVSAMYMLPGSVALEDVPDIGGALMQWHVHDNLCFTTDEVAPQVATVTSSGGPCPAGTVMFAPYAMIHVWIVPHQCGPFAALEGIGAGQILADEERLCDHLHGSA
jgi:hypothetical protein